VYSRAALLFFVVAFLTFMAIAAFPAFVEDMKVRNWAILHHCHDKRKFHSGLLYLVVLATEADMDPDSVVVFFDT